MSVEGLLNEAKHFHANNLDVAFGEQLFFGGKRVFSSFHPQTSNNDNRKDNKKDGKGKGAKNELKEAIGQAKNIVNQALQGTTPTDNENDFATLRKSHDNLTQKVEQLASLVSELQLELASLRQNKVGIRTVLILGDGNLSFSLSCAKSDSDTYFFATVFDSKDEFLRKYRASDTLARLEKLENVCLRFGVDATALPLSWVSKFQKIIMNFPHPGGKTNLKNSRILLSGIFKSLRKIMNEDSEFWLSLATGQSGFQAVENEWTKEPPKHNKDSWQSIYLGAEENFFLSHVEVFNPKKFSEYCSSGYKESEKGFNNHEGLTMVFKISTRCIKSLKTYERPDNVQSRGLFSAYKPFFVQDLSFLFKTSEEEGEKMALKLIRSLSKDLIVSINEVVELRSMCPDPFLPNRIYRVTWQSKAVPIGKTKCSSLHEELRMEISNTISKENLPLVLT